jgi:hypothetical protein
MEHQYSVYRGRDKTIFIVAPKRILVQTPTQEFYVTTEMWDGEEDIELVRYFIEKGIIRDMRSLRRRINGKYVLLSTYKRHNVLDVIEMLNKNEAL